MKAISNLIKFGTRALSYNIYFLYHVAYFALPFHKFLTFLLFYTNIQFTYQGLFPDIFSPKFHPNLMPSKNLYEIYGCSWFFHYFWYIFLNYSLWALWKLEKDILENLFAVSLLLLNTFDLPGNVPWHSTFDWQKTEEKYRKLTQQGYWMIEQETQSIYPNFSS